MKRDITKEHVGFSFRNSSTSIAQTEHVSYHIGHLPGRRSICFYMIDGTKVTPLMYAADLGRGLLALDALRRLLGSDVTK